MAKFRVLDAEVQVMGETEAEDGWAAIAWASREFRAKQPRVNPMQIERDDGEGWKLMFTSEMGQG